MQLFKVCVAAGLSTLFPDRLGSHQTSLGLFLTDATYQGKNGYSLKLHGLSKGFNESAMRRMIVMHGAPYVNPRTAKEIFWDIQHPDLGEHQIKNPNPGDFLGVLYFLKKYPTKKSQASFIGCSDKHGLPKAWKYASSI